MATRSLSHIGNDRVMRHANGGALKFGTEVHVSPDSYCDRATELGGDCAILQCTLKNSIITDSKVFDCAGESVWLSRSVCSKSSLQGVFAHECILDRVIASNEGSEGILTLKDVVAENCELHGSWKLEGIARIPTGCWFRPPRFLHITGDNNVSVGLTESTDGYALMACWRKPITSWLRAGPRLGRLHGWSSEQIRAAKEFYESLADCPVEGVRI